MNRTTNLRSLRFSTDDVPPAKRFSAWRDFLAPVLTAYDAGEDAEGTFHAALGMYDFDGLLIGRMSGGHSLLARTQADITASPQIDHILLEFSASNAANGSIAERPQACGRNSATLRDYWQPTTWTHVTDSILVQIPRNSAEEMLPGDPARVHGQIVRYSRCDLVHSLLSAVLQDADNLVRGDAADLRRSFEILIRGILHTAHAASSAEPMLSPRAALQSRIRKYINDTLKSEQLTPEDIASRFNLSRWMLYSCFEQLGGVATYIRSARLRKVRQLLENPLDNRPIKTIAAEYGFYDEQYFSRLFRAHFKLTAGSIRRRSGTDPALAAAAETRPQGRYIEFLLGANGDDKPVTRHNRDHSADAKGRMSWTS